MCAASWLARARMRWRMRWAGLGIGFAALQETSNKKNFVFNGGIVVVVHTGLPNTAHKHTMCSSWGFRPPDKPKSIPDDPFWIRFRNQDWGRKSSKIKPRSQRESSAKKNGPLKTNKPQNERTPTRGPPGPDPRGGGRGRGISPPQNGSWQLSDSRPP